MRSPWHGFGLRGLRSRPGPETGVYPPASATVPRHLPDLVRRRSRAKRRAHETEREYEKPGPAPVPVVPPWGRRWALAARPDGRAAPIRRQSGEGWSGHGFRNHADDDAYLYEVKASTGGSGVLGQRANGFRAYGRAIAGEVVQRMQCAAQARAQNWTPKRTVAPVF